MNETFVYVVNHERSLAVFSTLAKAWEYFSRFYPEFYYGSDFDLKEVEEVLDRKEKDFTFIAIKNDIGEEVLIRKEKII